MLAGIEGINEERRGRLERLGVEDGVERLERGERPVGVCRVIICVGVASAGEVEKGTFFAEVRVETRTGVLDVNLRSKKKGQFSKVYET